MKTKRTMVAAVLLISLLLSMIGGSFVSAAAPQTVKTDSELAYAPLARESSVAYEEHEDGYTVSLDRAADDVTMNISAVPATGRSANGARLFIQTGAVLKANTTYRVSFTLSAEKAQKDYSICFDRGAEKNAFGKLDSRAIEAGGIDQVSYEITTNKAGGELVLRLLLGKTEAKGNTFCFSGLAVEEVVGEAVGENVVLVDDLDYNAPESISYWTNTGFQAAVTSSGKSATLTVLKKPARSEVWEIQLKVATGLKLEAGKSYLVSADLSSKAVAQFEVCYNNGGIEKGYDALYGQWLEGRDLTLNHMIDVPADKENPGELILQFSLGNLKVGDKVTVSGIRVAEATPRYTNASALPQSYSLGWTELEDKDVQEVSGGKILDTNIDWTGTMSAIAKGNNVGRLTYSSDRKSATLKVNPSDEANNKPWEARYHILTGENITAGSKVRVSFKILSDITYTPDQPADNQVEIKFGTGLTDDGIDTKGEHGNTFRPVPANTPTTITHEFMAKASGELVVTLYVGKTNGKGSTVTVSDFEIEEEKITLGGKLADVDYPDGDPGSFEVRDGKGSIIGDGESTTMTCIAPDPAPDYWQRGLFVNDVCGLEANSDYEVSFDIEASESTRYRVCYNKDDKWTDGNLHREENLTANSTKQTVTQDISTTEGGTLILRLDLGFAAENTTVKVSNIRVKNTTKNENVSLLATYPKPVTSTGHFRAREDDEHDAGALSGDTKSVTITFKDAVADWARGLYTNNFGHLEANTPYMVSFDVAVANSKDFDCKVVYWKDRDWNYWVEGTNDNTEGNYLISNTGTGKFEGIFTPTTDGDLRLMIDCKNADANAKVTISNLQVREFIDSTTVTTTPDSFGSIWTDHGPGYRCAVVRGKEDAGFVVWKDDPDTSVEGWKAKMIIDTGVPYEFGKGYRFSFDITSSEAVREFGAGYNDAASIDSGTWGHSLSAGEHKTIVSHGLQGVNGNVTIVLEMGKFYGNSTGATISNIQVEEVDIVNARVHQLTGNVSFDAQEGYSAELDRHGNSVTLNIAETPASGMESWKSKMFINTGIATAPSQGYRISFDVLTENDADLEVCYNQGDTEKGLGAVYGIHTKAGEAQTITATCAVVEQRDKNDLRVQLNLGMVQGPNAVTVSNFKVERVKYSFSSANSAKVSYRAPSAISYWAHEDYKLVLTGSDDASTASITETPSGGAEDWKVKLWVDTGAVLKPGKYYKVTAKVVGEKSQDFAVCYNNGNVENGYDSMYGLRMIAGKPQIVEKLISVPADKKDAVNLTLQLNLGKTTAANKVTVSDVTVEEVVLTYTDMMGPNFAYKADETTSFWAYTDYAGKLETLSNGAIAHITSVSSDPAVWKAKLFVNTGAMLQAGKTYLVRAEMKAPKAQSYEVCFNNEETEKGYDAMYGQWLPADTLTKVEKSISVPASMTDAGELILQFAVGGDVTNDVTVTNVSVQEVSYGASGGASAPDAVIGLYQAPQTGLGTLNVTREKLTYKMTKISSQAKDNAVTIQSAGLRAGDQYTVAFTAKADKDLTGTLLLNQADNGAAVLSEQFQLTSKETQYSFTTQNPLSKSGLYDLLWQFGSEDNRKLGSANVEISNISVYAPAETLEISHAAPNVTVNGKSAAPDVYNINGTDYYKLRDLAAMMNDTDAQFVVRYNSKSNLLSITVGKAYTPIGGELTASANKAASCTRSTWNMAVNGETALLKAYTIGGDDYFRIQDLQKVIGFKVAYAGDTVAITSALTPEAQEKNHAYDLYFLPEVDGEAQPYVGDTMPYYEDGVFYTYYLKDGGDAYNHSVYVVSTKDFVNYTEYDDPVLSASREDVQDNWIGTGSVVKVDGTYYFFYTGFNSSGSQEYHEKIMVAKSSSPTGVFEKIKGWEIVPPASLGQKNDFRDPQAYYDPATQTISLTITASQEGRARILKYTLGKDLQNAKYDGIIFTDPTGAFWNLECSDTFKLGNKWYLTYSGQDDTLWYAMADSRFGPYTAPTRLEGKLFYAAKHVEDGTNSYMVGWARRANSASSTQEVSGWAGNLAVQKLRQNADGTLTLVPVDGIVSAFNKQVAPSTTAAALKADSGRSYKEAFTSSESFMLEGEFTYTGTGSFGLAFDFNGQEEQYKLVSVDPAANKLSLSLNGGAAPITESKAALQAGQKYSFTYIQDGSVGIFYLDGQAALTVRVYGVTDKPIYLFAENNNVTFTSLRQFTR